MEFIYHQNQKTLHIGTEKPHAYFIPFLSGKTAMEEARENSPLFVDLCGEWQFHYYSALCDIPNFTSEDYDIGLDTLPVPMSWQYAKGKKYDNAQYTNVRYPIPVVPPYVPVENPCGLYQKKVEVTDEMLTKEVHLLFDGVDSCFYLYINKKFVGYSQVAHMTSEFVVNNFLHEGENLIQVLVLKWCDGTYLECQDKIRSSGIIRPLYFLLREKDGIQDFEVKQDVKSDLKSAEITLLVEANADVAYSLYDEKGNPVAVGETANGKAVFTLENPTLWNDEKPTLYSLILLCAGEYICQKIGLRRYEILDKVVYINGKKVKARGVNRHDSNPETGSYTSYEDMKKDLMIMKSHNINFVRTSHYPNDPRFLELCNKYGFYICDETDLEAHGMGRLPRETTKGWDTLSDDPEWELAYVDRAERMVERDKNQCCVFMWSLGNESGCGCNQEKMSDYIHARLGKNAYVHWEDMTRRMVSDFCCAEIPVMDKVSSPYVDIDSRMYPNTEDIKRNHVENNDAKNPFFLCEYSHAMGNGPGDLEAYWEVIYKYDSFFGGCVWEFTDHSMNVGTLKKPKFLYGGDLKNEYNDSNFCVDGLVYPNRIPHTGLIEYKEVLRPVRLVSYDAKTATVTLESKRYFSDLSNLEVLWTLTKNGFVLEDGKLANFKIKPCEKKSFTLKMETTEFVDDTILTFSYRQKTSTPWQKKGYEVGFDQVILSVREDEIPADDCEHLEFSENEKTYAVTLGNALYTLDKARGFVVSIKKDGKELLSSPIVPNIWRAPTDNDRKIKRDWYPYSYHQMHTFAYGLKLVEKTEDKIVLETPMVLGAGGVEPIMDLKVVYSFEKDKGLRLTLDGETRKHPHPFLPRFGVMFAMPKEFENLTYFANGPYESYEDKCHASSLGLYSTTIEENMEHYVRPQENGAHNKARFMSLSNGEIELSVNSTKENPTFSFNASPYSAINLTETAHDYELKSDGNNYVYIDEKQSGMGSASCGPSLGDEYKVDGKCHLSFILDIL